MNFIKKYVNRFGLKLWSHCDEIVAMRKPTAFSMLLTLAACAHVDSTDHHKLNELYERNQIEDTVNRLFIATDNKDWNQIQTLFTPEVQFDMSSLAGGSPQVLTPKAIVALWTEGLMPVVQVHHQSGNFLTQVNETQAEVFCYGTATHYKNPQFKHKIVVSFVGSYNLHLIKSGNAWKISELKFNKKYVE